MRWMAAISGPNKPDFDPSSLVFWRSLVAASERPHRINDAVKTVAEQPRSSRAVVAQVATWRGSRLSTQTNRWCHPGHCPRRMGPGFRHAVSR